MRNILRILLSFDNVMIILGTIGLAAALYFIPQNMDFLNPVGQALSDLDLTDMVFSKFRDDSKITSDTNIVVVNIGDEDRAGIAKILDNINRHDPAAVGVDAFFRFPKDPEGDSLLALSLGQTKNLVLVSKVAFKSDSPEYIPTAKDSVPRNVESDFDTLETSNPMFMQGARTGFANLIVDQQKSFMTCRETSFREEYNGNTEPCFAVALANFFDPEKAKIAMSRPEGAEAVNFRGNRQMFYVVDVDQALNDEEYLSIVKGKIVILGYMGPELGANVLVDNFFTPLNEQYVGRSYPDMYGVIIHANILSMILHEEYINKMPFWSSIVLGFSVLIFNVLFFTYMYTRHESWYDVFAVGMQLGESLLALFLIVYVFANYNYKLALTPALFGVFLVGTVHDLYQDSVKKLILTAVERVKRRRRVASSQSRSRTNTPSKK